MVCIIIPRLFYLRQQITSHLLQIVAKKETTSRMLNTFAHVQHIHQQIAPWTILNRHVNYKKR